MVLSLLSAINSSRESTEYFGGEVSFMFRMHSEGGVGTLFTFASFVCFGSRTGSLLKGMVGSDLTSDGSELSLRGAVFFGPPLVGILASLAPSLSLAGLQFCQWFT